MNRYLLLLSGLAGALFLALASDPALAEKRVALIIGNSAYRNVALLPNPERDAASIAKLFKDAGFNTVVAENNVGNLDFKRAIRNFEDAAIDSDIAVVFYAGHGIEIGGVNYLIPVDARLIKDRDAQDEAIPLDRLIESVEGAKRLRLIILDACRDNPFGKKIKRMIASRSISPGLGKVEPSGSDTLIAYAAKAGSTAEDGDGAHSPFTTALLANLTAPGLDIRLAFGRVRDQVMKITDRRQEPFVYGSLGGGNISLVPAAPQRVEPAAPSVENIVRDYQFAERIGTRQAWDSFLAAHADSFYANLAKAARDKLIAAEEKQKREDDARLKSAVEEAKRRAGDDAKKQAAEEVRLRAEAEAKRKADEDARVRADLEAKAKAAEQAKSSSQTVVAVAPAQPVIEPPSKSAMPAIDAADLARLLQFHLKRVGCDPGSVEGVWGDGARRALAQFNNRAGTKFDVKVASIDALETVKAQKTRICPLVCGNGYRVENDRCEPEPKDASKPKKTPAERSAEKPGESGGGGQVFCDRGGCRPVPKNCRIGFGTGGNPSQTANVSQHKLECH